MVKILFIGDSLTFGFGIKKEDRWVNLCSKTLNIITINKGLNGDSTSGMLCRSYEDIILNSPSYVCIMGGTNDFFMNLSVDSVIENLILLSKEAINNNIIPILCTPIPVNAEMAKSFWDEFIDYEAVNSKLIQLKYRIKDFCENNNIFYIDMHSLYCKNSYEILYIDGVHPNKIGHDLISYNFITHFKNYHTN